jgi:hypothetical protein
MDKPSNITRRAAIVGAAATVTAISPALGAAYRSGAKSTDQLLVELADQFKRDAMAVDPTITGIWLCRDMRMESNYAGAPNAIIFERKGEPLRASDEKAGVA